MHIAGKIFLGLGVLITLAGAVMTIGGGAALSDAGQWDVNEKSEFSGSAGAITYSYSGEDILVMVSDDVRCDEFTITMTNETGENHLKADCEDDGEKPWGWEDDPSGWYHMATISWWDYDSGEYTIDANENYELVPMWEIILEEGGEAVGGFFAALGGVTTICCGVFFLILGGIFAIVMKEPKKTMITEPSSFATDN